MRFPEWMYRLLSGDEGTQLLQVLWREAAATQAALTVGGTVYSVPNDRCLILTNAAVQWTCGGAAGVTRRRLMADPPAGTTRYNIFDEEADGTGGTILSSNWQGEVIIPGGWRVRAEADFSTTNAANGFSAEIHGYLVPRGTIIFA